MDIIKTPIDIKTLIQTSTIDIYDKTKLVEKLKHHFSEDEQRLYVCNLFLFLNYHPINDFIINLDNVWKFIGFSNKANAKRLLKHNFTEEKDYKITLIRTDEQKKDNRGGHNEETIMLNINTFKKLCLKANTENADKIHDYYIRLEMIYNQLMKEEFDEQKLLLETEKKNTQNTQNQLQLLELENQEKQDKINLLTRKTNKFELGESVYIFHSTIDNLDLYKVGRTKNANSRDAIHKTASYKGILLQIKCVDCVLLERVVHFLLNKYRCANRREWFNCSYDIVKNSIDYAKLLLESDIDFENQHLINDTTDFIDTIKHSTNLNENNNIASPTFNTVVVRRQGTITNDIFTTIQFTANDVNNFEKFLTDNCEKEDSDTSVSYITIKNQYKIWSKTAKHSQLKKLIDYVKLHYTTSMKRHNQLVSTSKLTQHFNGLKLKRSLFEFEKPQNENNVIENFLYEKCQRAPGYRITMQDFFLEFENWYSNTFTNVIKEKLKNYLDIQFIRLRTGDESNGKDGRLGGWLGFSLKSNDQPEPIKHYKPKNAKQILQINSSTNETINTWNSVSELSDYINRSRSVTSSLIKRHEQIYIDNILCILQYK